MSISRSIIEAMRTGGDHIKAKLAANIEHIVRRLAHGTMT
jgi:hypothetical protein